MGKTELGLANPFSLDLADEDKLSIDIDCHAALVIFSNVIRQRHLSNLLVEQNLLFFLMNILMHAVQATVSVKTCQCIIIYLRN